MARRGGFGGGNNMGQMMKQVQQMQKKMEEAQKEIEVATVTATSGGGVVEVEANGKKENTSSTQRQTGTWFGRYYIILKYILVVSMTLLIS